jgi:hypothetical protein
MLVDTSIWIDAFSEKPSPARDRLLRAMRDHEVLVGDLIMVELLQGLRPGPKLRLVEATMAGMRAVTLCGPRLASRAADNYRQLRGRGVTVRGTIDVIIATWCIENTQALLHNDRDFDVFERHLGLVIWR